MSERKSSRSRKPISYATLGDESDDDFASGPSTKKSKQSSKQVEKCSKGREEKMEPKTSTQTSRSSSSILKRESVFDLELQRVLEMSKQDAGDLSFNSSTTESSHTRRVRADIELVPTVPPLERIDHLLKVNPPPITTEASPEPPCLVPVTSPGMAPMDHTIEAVQSKDDEENVNTGKHTPRHAATKVKKFVSEDERDSEAESDFCSRASSSEDEDDDEFSPDDDDSDFDDGRRKPKKKDPVKPQKKLSDASKTVNPKTTKKAVKSSLKDSADSTSLTSKTPTSRKTTASKPAQPVVASSTPRLSSIPSSSSPASSSASTPSPSSKISDVSPKTAPSSSSRVSVPVSGKPSTPSPLVHRHWKPPGQASSASSSSIKSPTSGLRLGLSRNQRVKPLHSSVKVG